MDELWLNPRRYKGGGGGGLGVVAKVFWCFFLEEKASTPDVFSSCLFIPRADFQRSLVMVSCYGYEIWRQLLSTIEVNLVAKIMQSVYLCVIFHMKLKKLLFLAVLT